MCVGGWGGISTCVCVGGWGGISTCVCVGGWGGISTCVCIGGWGGKVHRAVGSSRASRALALPLLGLGTKIITNYSQSKACSS